MVLSIAYSDVQFAGWKARLEYSDVQFAGCKGWLPNTIEGDEIDPCWLEYFTWYNAPPLITDHWSLITAHSTLNTAHSILHSQ